MSSEFKYVRNFAIPLEILKKIKIFTNFERETESGGEREREMPRKKMDCYILYMKVG